MATVTTAEDRLLSEAADRILAVDDLVAEKREEFAARYVELLNSTEQRNQEIEDKYINYMAIQSVDELGNDSMVPFWQAVADTMDVPWDELNSIPNNLRGPAFNATRSTLSAAVWEQAFIEVGLAEETVRLGLEMGDVAAELASQVDLEKLASGPGVKDVMAKKLEDREVGTADSPFTQEALEEEENGNG